MVGKDGPIFWCTNCLNMSTRPRITFDSEGKCNACSWSFEKKKLDWGKRSEELKYILGANRSRDGSHDCIVPVSGGKDGSYVAHQLKHIYGMNPLTITVSPALALDLGNRNLENFISSGFTNIKFNLNPNILQKVNKVGFEKWGFPYYGWLLGIKTVPVRLALNLGINLIFYGEDGEIEYGGSSETRNTPHYDSEYMRRIYFEDGQDLVLNSANLIEQERYWFEFPNSNHNSYSNLKILHWSYFENWDPYRNYMVAKEHCGLEEATTTNDGTFTNFAQNDQGLYALHAYMMYLKFGFGRATQDAGIEIRRGAMNREQGLSLTKMFDGKYPEIWEDQYLDYYRITKKEFYTILESHTNRDLFEIKEGRVKPKFEIL
jgi:N-acetyl sugar amidotransferase